MRKADDTSFVLGEFESAAALLEAIPILQQHGFAKLDAHTPYPLPELTRRLGLARSRVPLLVLLGGLGGAMVGYLMQWLVNARLFPQNTGGRPAHAPLSFVPVTFEVGILLGAFAAFFGVLALMRLPKLYHPVFDADSFERASLDRFWISIELAPDEVSKRDAAETLHKLGAIKVAQVIR